MYPYIEINLSSSISAEAINNNLNKTNKHVHHLNNSKLGYATVLTATAAANSRCGELIFTLTD